MQGITTRVSTDLQLLCRLTREGRHRRCFVVYASTDIIFQTIGSQGELIGEMQGLATLSQQNLTTRRFSGAQSAERTGRILELCFSCALNMTEDYLPYATRQNMDSSPCALTTTSYLAAFAKMPNAHAWLAQSVTDRQASCGQGCTRFWHALIGGI